MLISIEIDCLLIQWSFYGCWVLMVIHPLQMSKLRVWMSFRGSTHSRVFDSVVKISGALIALIPGSLYQCFIVA